MSTRRGAANVVWVVVALVVVLGGVGLVVATTGGSDEEGTELEVVLAETKSFNYSIIEHGEIEAAKSVDVVCQVKSEGRSGTAILWVVEEGTKVKKGDRLVTLDSASLEDQLITQRVAVNRAVADQIKAQSVLDQAIITKSEYLDGVFVQDQKLMSSDILVAEETLSRAQDNAGYSKRLFDLGFITKQDFQSDEFAVKEAEVQLQIAKDKLSTLKDITKRRMLVGYNADIESARADLEAKTSTLTEEQAELKDIEQQIKYCEISAPVDGLVVYANVQSRRGGQEFIVEPGATVRERQAIIKLPDPDSMQVRARINEGKVTKLAVGMPVAITVGSSKQLVEGRVKTVNKYAEPGSFFSSQVKEYVSLIEIPDPPPSIRTGMTAEVEIFVKQIEDATILPIEALFEHRGHIFVLKSENGAYSTEEIELIGTNDEHAAVAKGVEPGDGIVMKPRRHLDLLEIPSGLEDLTRRVITDTAAVE